MWIVYVLTLTYTCIMCVCYILFVYVLRIHRMCVADELCIGCACVIRGLCVIYTSCSCIVCTCMCVVMYICAGYVCDMRVMLVLCVHYVYIVRCVGVIWFIIGCDMHTS